MASSDYRPRQHDSRCTGRDRHGSSSVSGSSGHPPSSPNDGSESSRDGTSRSPGRASRYGCRRTRTGLIAQFLPSLACEHPSSLLPAGVWCPCCLGSAVVGAVYEGLQRVDGRKPKTYQINDLTVADPSVQLAISKRSSKRKSTKILNSVEAKAVYATSTSRHGRVQADRSIALTRAVTLAVTIETRKHHRARLNSVAVSPARGFPIR
mmetsp:Transcript_29484/g.52785  ORF Transcript_29484/g.52785 Transcript_29484/m.52785 type:complete len:208 (-) Transcript_29484:378-1001(-)